MKQVHPNYTFVASTKTITLTGLNIAQDQLLLITNATRGVIYYNFASSSHRAVVTAGANTTVVLTDASTTGHANEDQLVIHYDDQLSTQTVAGAVTANPSAYNLLTTTVTTLSFSSGGDSPVFSITPDLNGTWGFYADFDGSTNCVYKLQQTLSNGGSPQDVTVYSSANFEQPVTSFTSYQTLFVKYGSLPKSETNVWPMPVYFTFTKVSGITGSTISATIFKVNIPNHGFSSLVSGTVTVGNSVTIGSLPDGVATSANQSTGNTHLSNIDTDIGALADSAATTDTGSFSLISLFKRLLGKIPNLSGGRLPVTVSGDLTSIQVQGISGSPTPVLAGGMRGTSIDSIKLDPSSGRLLTEVSGFSATSLPLPTGAATSANQTTTNTSIGATTEPAATDDNANSGLVGLFKRLLQKTPTLVTASNISGNQVQSIPVAIMYAGTTQNVSVTNASFPPVTIGSGTVTAASDKGSVSEASTQSITTGGTHQQVFASNASRKYLLIQNISDTDMYLGLGFNPSNTTPAGLLLARNGGGIVFESSYIPTSEVRIVCATTGKRFVALQG